MAESGDLTQPLIPQTNSIVNDLTTKMTEIVEMYISGKDKLGYINGDFPQPPETDPSFRRWRTENAIVKGWLINSMDPSLIANFIRFPTTKQEDHVYTFLDGLDDRLDKTRSDVLQLKPFPTVEQAYAFVRRGDVRQTVMISGADTTPGAVMASKGIKGSHYHTQLKPGALSLSSGKSNSSSKTKTPSGGMKCTHCGNSIHTRDTCFKLHGKAVMVTCDPSLPLIPQVESPHDPGYSHQEDNWACHGILHETSCSQTPQQNGTAEKKNMHILETTRALLINAHVPNRYWSDAVATAVHLLNLLNVGDNLAHPNDGNDMVEPPRIEAKPVPESSEGKPPYQYSLDIEEQRSKYPIAKYVSTQRLSEPLEAFAHTLSSCQILSSVEEALLDSKWAQAIKEELEALQKNNTWFLSVLPEGRKIMGCKWIFSIKYKADGSIDRYKAKLVAKGYTHKYVNLDWPLHQLDVKNAFLHGDLEEEIFMDIPPGYTATDRNFSIVPKYLAFLRSNSEVGLLECKPVDIPIVQNHKLGEYVDQVPADKQRYQRLVGKLIYLSHARPDIAYVVSVVSQFMHCPSEDHMDVVMRILRYLKSSPGKGLMFSKNGHLNVAGYIDADWAGNITNRKSTLGYFTFVGGN
ncbi:putative mitochondrial protein [Vitis vinifera]|uniref:Putative mitochondrial protein n=1 Tax=Vitis vinifera TaxID=29760 RepID=A0A438J5C3_VITVI|nr:putative mitochondrial protein [Vitis vinifera]